MSKIVTYKGHRCRQDMCPTCQRDKGLVRLSRLGRDCHICNSKKMAIVGSTHNGQLEKVRQANKLLRKKQVITISEETKLKISIANKKTWLDKHGVPTDLAHKKCRQSFSKLLSRYAKRRHLTPKSQQSKFNHLGYSPQQLFEHLASLFQPGMTWNNYGEWHIDHKVPDSWFVYSNFEDFDFKKSWSLNNLQPKWADENRRKGNRFSD